MKNIAISRRNLLLAISVWFIFFLVLTLTQFNNFQSLNIIGFSFLLLVPGFITAHSFNFKYYDIWSYIGISIGFSIFELIGITLIGNTFLRFVHVNDPLSKHIILLEVFLLVFGLCAILFHRLKPIELHIKKYVLFQSGWDCIYAFFPVTFVVMACIGAITLNNGGNNAYTLTMLLGIGMYVFFLIYTSEYLEDNVMPTALFFLSLSLLLMTSLRGFLIVGHDIQREYYVFQLAKNNNIWSIVNFRDPYNACLSITLLPTIFSKLLKFFDPYIYKVLFQIIFAVVPVIIYTHIKRYVSNAIAFLSTFYFLAFPTFFADMPFLNRQEIAFLFFVLTIFVIFDPHIRLGIKRLIFIIFGIGMVLSHYSTTYTVIVMLGFFLISNPIIQYIGKYVRKKKTFPNAALSGFDPKIKRTKPFITVGMVVLLAVASFLWSSVLTNTASNSLYRVVTETFSMIKKSNKDEAHAGELSYSLLSWRTPNLPLLMEDYIQKIVNPARNHARDTYYSDIDYEKYPLRIHSGDFVPPTYAGKLFSLIGINVFVLNYIFRQASAKLLQILVLIGFCSLLYTKKFFNKPLTNEYVLLAGGGMLLMAAMLILPVLSVEYGILRAFQQALIFLGLLIVIGSMTLCVNFAIKKRIILATCLALLFFFSTTGVFIQLLGGSDLQLHLNNGGLYYSLYYTRTVEIDGLQWLLHESNGINIQTDKYSQTKAYSIYNLTNVSDIYPGLIKKDSYVFLNYTNVHNKQVTFEYKGILITYSYPIAFLDSHKNLIYNNGGVRTYK